MEIKVLGPGCKKCNTLAKATQEAVSELGIEANITKIDDMLKILAYGVLNTPALVINEKLVLSGKLASVAEIKEFIQKA